MLWNPLYQAELLLKLTSDRYRKELVPILREEFFDESLRPIAAIMLKRKPAPRTIAQLQQALEEKGLTMPSIPPGSDASFDKEQVAKMVRVHELRDRYLAEVEEIESGDGAVDPGGDEGESILTLSKVKPRRNLVTTGIKGLDRIMKGGLGGAEFGVVMAVSGGGKTSILVHFARSAVLAGLRAVFFELEMSKDNIKARVLTSLTSITPSQLAANRKNREKCDRLLRKLRRSGGDVLIRAGASQSIPLAEIERYATAMAADVILIDPGDKVRRPRNLNDRRVELNETYEGLNQLAIRTEKPVWVTTQSNRAGFGKARIGLTEVAEAVGKIQEASLVVSLNALGHDELSLFVCKNRFGEPDQEALVKVDWELCRVYG